LKILLIGKNGQVGHELLRSLSALGEVVATDRSQLDLTDVDLIRRVTWEARPNVIVNAAAYNAVDRAEHEEPLAVAVNSTAPAVLAETANRLDALLVHYSTDYVFDGRKQTPYLEDDPPAPLNAYGRSKLAGELAVRSSGCRYLLLRTSWVFGSHGSNFVSAIAGRALAGQDLRVVADQTGVPTPSSFVADSTAKMIGSNPSQGGLYHVVASGQTTRFDFARAIVDGLGAKVRVTPATSEEFRAPAKRPRYSVLDNSKIRKDFNIIPPRWDAHLRQCLVESRRNI
jgi:dTDP-4-dehydrorhamnose reductase